MTIWIKGSQSIGNDEFDFLTPIPANFDGAHTAEQLGYLNVRRYDDWEGLRFYAINDYFGRLREVHVGLYNPSFNAYERIGDLYLDPLSREHENCGMVSGVGLRPNERGKGYGYSLYTHAILNLGVLLASDTVHYEGSRKLWHKLAADDRITVYTDLNEHRLGAPGYKPDYRQIYVEDDELLVDGLDESVVWLKTNATTHYQEGPSQRPAGVSLPKYNRIANRRLYGIARQDEDL